jgi:hypothetical protein
MFRKIRILVLLLILLSVALGAWRAKARATQWKHPLSVVVYPINGDGSPASAKYIETVSAATFAPIEAFMAEEAARHGIATQYGNPVRVDRAPEVKSLPPPPPIGGNVLQIMAWSLRLRYWAWRADTYAGATPQVQIFVAYFDPATNERVAHSLGLEKGMIGVVNAFSHPRMTATNNVVITHELLHTVGATDKYNPATDQPRFPDGYAEPELRPRYPQNFAEIMAGRIPVSQARSEIPRTLEQTLIGEWTAKEINWMK